MERSFPATFGRGWVGLNGASPTVEYTQGKTLLTLTVIDDQGASATDAVVVTVTGGSVDAPSGMVRVDGGAFYRIYFVEWRRETFYIKDRRKLLWGEWQTVRNWAAARGYDLGVLGAGCSDDHPGDSVDWFDAVKWCNARSEMDGLDQNYTVSGATFRGGRISASSVSLRLVGEWLSLADVCRVEPCRGRW